MSQDTARVWLIRLASPAPVLAGLEAVLDDAERARAAALGGPGQRQRFIVAHGAARVIIGRLAGGPAGQLGRYIRLWARKEACVKVTGGVLTDGLRLPVRGRGPVVVHDPGGLLPGPYLVRDVVVPRRFRAAVAAEGAQDYQVARHWWPDGQDRPGDEAAGGTG